MRSRGPLTYGIAFDLRRPWVLVLPIALFILLVGLEWVYRGHGGWQAVVVTVRLAGIQLLGLAFSVRAANEPSLSAAARRVWRLLAIAFILQLISTTGIAASVASGEPGKRILLLVGLLCRFMFVPVLLAGLLALSSPALDRPSRWKLTMDALTVVGAGFMVLWYFAVGPALEGNVHYTDAGFLIVLYALGDLILIIGLGLVLLRGTRAEARSPVILLLAGAVSLLVGDLALLAVAIYEPLTVVSASVIGINILFTLPPLFLALAAIEQCRHAVRTDRPVRARPVMTPTWLPYAATGIGIAVLALASIRSGLYPWVGLILGSTMITVGVTVRQIIALRENRRMAVTDPLTGLANRTQLTQSLELAANRSRRTGRSLAVLQIDLVGFKQVNDAFGHATGDQLLLAFADLLRRNVRDSDMVSRLGGDEFAVIVTGVDATEEAVATAERILAEAGRPVAVGGTRMPMHASIGIAVAGPHQDFLDADPDLLLEQADKAMYAAKRQAGHGLQVYSADPARTPGPGDALDRLELVYEPIMSLPTGDLVGVEAQVRGAPSPASDEPDATDGVGWHALRRACLDVSTWQTLRPLDLTIRISPHQLTWGTAAAEIQATLDRFGLAHHQLVLQIAERRMNPNHPVVEQLQALRATGVRIALDGFGAGNASLLQVNQLPVTGLKLDQSFVDELDGTPESSAVAQAVARLAELAHLDTTAAGITSAQQCAELSEMGYHRAQGPYFSEPLSAGGMLAFIEADVSRDGRRPSQAN